jgi:diacylglycerol kinase family enzyme
VNLTQGHVWEGHGYFDANFGTAALEAAALDPHGVAEAVRLGLRAALPIGDWRDDASVSTELCRHGRAWAKGHIPGLIDGESHRFERSVTFSFRPDAFRALAPPIDPPPLPPEDVLTETVKAAH